jgi:predicted aspartyl protease
MRGGTGSLNQLGCPVVEIEVSGGVPGVRKRLSALLDTGFSGFLSIPILEAFPLGLMLRGTINAALADGSQQAKLICRGSVHFGGEIQDGVIIVEPSSDQALIGMEFLKRF